MSTLKSVVEWFSTLLMAASALALLVTLMRLPSSQSKGDPVTNLSVARADLRHVRGSGSTIVIELSDFQCPVCVSYATTSFKDVERRLLARGGASYSILNYPLEKIHPFARQAAHAAECAGEQGKYWQMHEALFAQSPRLAADDVVAAATSIGLDKSAFQTCLADSRDAVIDADLALGRRLGVTATPSFFIGVVTPDGRIDLKRRVVGALSPDDLVAQVDEVSGRPWWRPRILFSLLKVNGAVTSRF